MLRCVAGPLKGKAFPDLLSYLQAQADRRAACTHPNPAESTGETPRGKWRRSSCPDCGECLSLDYPA